MLPDDDKLWSAPYHPTPKTEQCFINLREWAIKRAIEMALQSFASETKWGIFEANLIH